MATVSIGAVPTGETLNIGSGKTIVGEGKITLAIGTITTSQPIISGTQTWNASGVTFDGILLDVTNTASAAASNLATLKVGGTTQWFVRKDGRVAVGASGNYVESCGFGTIDFYQASQFAGALYSGGLRLGSTGVVSWGDSNSPLATFDTFLRRDGANIVAQRNSTNAQAKRIYNTGDSTNGEWFAVDWKTTSNVCLVGAVAAGTGTKRPSQLDLYTGFAELTERASAPSAPGADAVRIYAIDNGAGKTQLMALFSSGAAQQLAIQP